MPSLCPSNTDTRRQTSKRSETTISSYDEVRTPNANSIGFTFHQLPVQDGPRGRGSKAMEGPSGPSLFRMSQESSANMDIYLSMSPPASPVAQRHPAPPTDQAPKQPPQQADLVFADAPRTSVPLRTWTPWQVADWMHSLGFERGIIDQFFVNDISGITLIDLQYDDLKELGISSFGQRHRLWTEIRNLRESTLASALPPTPGQEIHWQAPEPSPPLPQLETRREPTPPQKCPSPQSGEDEDEAAKKVARRAMRRAIRSDDILSPADSASIVAIEQLLPKPHKCSKGENCPKWRKQQRKLAKIATEFPLEYSQIVEGKQSPSLESGVNQANSTIGPSVIASSDVLGPAAPKVKLQEDALKNLQLRDPQDNVRQFLDFQHVASPKHAPDTPGYEMFPPLAPPDATTPRANFKALPKLTIPASPEEQPQNSHTIRSPAGDQTARPLRRSTTPLTAFYTQRAPVHDIYRIGSPASEMDVPVTALPLDPLGPNARDVSSSVPPDMRFGGPGDLISRSSSRQGQRERGPPPAFLNNYPFPGMAPGPGMMRRSNSQSGARTRRPSFGMTPLAEVKSPIGVTLTTRPRPTDDDEATSPSSGDTTPTATTGPQHAGWMRKRRTKLLRHEWAEAHYRLTGTQLTAHRDGQSLEMLDCIDVDDYAVAVAANGGKMASAMKRLRLNGKDKGDEVWKYGFQLTPAAEKRAVASGAGKTHHFAVRDGNERVDWMRELMLARAKKGKEVVHERFE